VLGFLPISTRSCLSDPVESCPFQSRAGFSPYLDRRGRDLPPGDRRRFNPVLGFLPISTPHVRGNMALRHGVSIPCWVFSLSRREQSRRDGEGEYVSIPCWVFSLSRRPTVYCWVGISVSIPCWVFSLSRHEGTSSIDLSWAVSIPCWVFSLSRHHEPA